MTTEVSRSIDLSARVAVDLAHTNHWHTARDMLIGSLCTRGLDGLYNDRLGCACFVDALAPCGAAQMDCAAGIRTACDCGRSEHEMHLRDHRAGHGGVGAVPRRDGQTGG